MLVLDALDRPTGDGENHNLGNTISCNAISGGAVLIDHGGDDLPPPAPIIEQVIVDGPVTVIGSTTPSLAGAVVEVFAVTGFRTESDTPVMNAVECRGLGVIGDDGRFAVTLASASPACAYAATVTDSGGTTSELGYGCGCPSRVEATPSSFIFGGPLLIDAAGGFPLQTLTVKNTGCDRVIRLGSLSFEKPSRAGRADKRNLFFIKPRSAGGDRVALLPGDSVTFNLFFRSVIPRPLRCRSGDATDLLSAQPRRAESILVIRQDGIGESLKLEVKSEVDAKVRLINPDCGQPLLPARVSFTRSRDQFLVKFGVYDSDNGVRRVTYQFLDSEGNRVGGPHEDNDIGSAIVHLAEGESFVALQPFIGAADHPEVAQVVVTVFDESGEDTATGNLQVSAQASSRAGEKESAVTVRLPVALIPFRSGRPYLLCCAAREGLNNRS